MPYAIMCQGHILAITEDKRFGGKPCSDGIANHPCPQAIEQIVARKDGSICLPEEINVSHQEMMDFFRKVLGG
jgi:hypothetical protein